MHIYNGIKEYASTIIQQICNQILSCNHYIYCTKMVSECVFALFIYYASNT